MGQLAQGRLDVAAAMLTDLLIRQYGTPALREVYEHTRPLVHMKLMEGLGPQTPAGRKAGNLAKKLAAFDAMVSPQASAVQTPEPITAKQGEVLDAVEVDQ